MDTPSAQDCIIGYGLPSRGGLIHIFVSSADMYLLLLIAPELRLAPLHALHDTSYCDKATNLLEVSQKRGEWCQLFIKIKIHDSFSSHVQCDSADIELWSVVIGLYGKDHCHYNSIIAQPVNTVCWCKTTMAQYYLISSSLDLQHLHMFQTVGLVTV